MASQFGMMAIINLFFAGFITLKLPFGLTERFKSVTQTGIGVAALDTSYVSSLSWYTTGRMGLPRLIALFRRTAMDPAEEARMLAMQSGMMMPGMGMGQQPQAWQPAPAYKAEDSALGLVDWSPVPLLHAEKELLQLHKARRSGASKQA
jgi:hypothetical protein